MWAINNKTSAEVQMIIAMKGHPGTGKSTLAHSLASSLRIPLIDKDDVRDPTFSLQSYLSPPPDTAAATASKLLNDLSYHVIWQIAQTQLCLGLSVIIDSPLSRRSHLDRLLRLASLTGACLVIVECKPSDEAEWRRRLEQRGGSSSTADDQGQRGAAGGWHKPSTWQELERLVKGYGGCTDYDVGDVPKLVVDTTAPVGLDEITSTVKEFLSSLSRLHN